MTNSAIIQNSIFKSSRIRTFLIQPKQFCEILLKTALCTILPFLMGFIAASSLALEPMTAAQMEAAALFYAYIAAVTVLISSRSYEKKSNLIVFSAMIINCAALGALISLC
ncbi:MAG: hypothetical protein K2X27_18490 [Candidatus Obscuribacterales bacterium]|nr:hypothetical protein [Candidatus Obscuribacterales bacterium]